MPEKIDRFYSSGIRISFGASSKLSEMADMDWIDPEETWYINDDYPYPSYPSQVLSDQSLHLKDAWYKKQPNDFTDTFELNAYCTKALSYVAELEKTLSTIKIMYENKWCLKQYKKESKHGFHAILAGTHSIFTIYKIFRKIFNFLFLISFVLLIANFFDMFAGFLITWIILKIIEFSLENIVGRNHRNIIKDNIRRRGIPDTCYPAHIFATTKEIKQLKDDIELFQQRWAEKLEN
ncbi:Uncharacterised protein [Moraxella caprae]|uniref:Uncharacterized protein n=1 Tax=Moraxella caprae TaxID=90240 RepID=A0A378R1W1_9GAMM|nr:hypothetical protein [Moraxella caprae]STZ08978.1 Uncharacterised protein [Moraxella caprae]